MMALSSELRVVLVDRDELCSCMLACYHGATKHVLGWGAGNVIACACVEARVPSACERSVRRGATEPRAGGDRPAPVAPASPVCPPHKSSLF